MPMTEHSAEKGLPLTVTPVCIGCGEPNPTSVHIGGCADAQRKLNEPAEFEPLDLPECDLCGRTDCPDADLAEFSEPVACRYKPVYDELRYDRCEYGCGRDITKATIRRATRLIASEGSTP